MLTMTTPNKQQHAYLTSELRRLSNPRRSSQTTKIQPVNAEQHRNHQLASSHMLKDELLHIHRRKTGQKGHYRVKKKKRKRHSAHTIHPVYEQQNHLNDELPINALLSIVESNKLGSYNKDYILLSKEHKTMERYRIRIHRRKRDNTSYQPPSCINCRSVRRNFKVFFPCEHMCLCSKCINRKMPKQCPLCNSRISIVLNHTDTGDEHEEYWKWIEEVKPSISTAFVKTFFANSKDAIRIAMAEMNNDSSSSLSSEDDSLTTTNYVEVESDHSHDKEKGGSILSCLAILLCRRASHFVEEESST